MGDKNQKPVAFRALQIANEQRITYGLRYNDFKRYRKHCASRTHRLRSTLKMTHGKGRDFKKLPVVSSDSLSAKHLELFLLEAERAWVYAQELIAISSQHENQANASALLHRATSRFRRAVNWSTQLLSHCQTLFASSRLSAENLVQSTIYTLILNGRFLRYRDHFGDALIQLCVARNLLDELAAAASTSRDQALATLFSDEISPEIRYCAHELGRSKAYDVQSIVEEVASQHRNTIVDGCDALLNNLKMDLEAATKMAVRRKLSPLVWEGQLVPVRNPELVDVLLKVQEAEEKLSDGQVGDVGSSKEREQAEEPKQTTGRSSKKGVAAYDTILLALSDAEDVSRKLAEAQQMSGINLGASTAGTRDMHFVHAYIVYQLLSRRTQRDLLLISALLSSQHSASTRPVLRTEKKPSVTSPRSEQVDGRLYPAVVKMLDAVLQSLNQMRTLSIVEESPDLVSAVEARLCFSKCQRCLYLARCYTPVHKYAEGLTLIQYATIHLREMRSIVSSLDFDPITSGNPAYYPLSSADIDKLETDLFNLGLQLKKDWFAYNGGIAKSDNISYQKPLFFDIALNYVQLDMDRLQERAGKKLAPSLSTYAKALPGKVQSQQEKKQTPKAKVEEARAETPEPPSPAQSRLSSLLGGWWGRS